MSQSRRTTCVAPGPRSRPLRRTARRRAPVLLAALVLSSLAGRSAALPRESERWIELVTDNFHFFSGVNETQTRAFANALEDLRATLAQYGGDLELNAPTPTYLYIFRNDARFRPYKLQVDGRPARVAGFFAAHTHGNYVAVDGDPKREPERSVYHEYLHYVLRNNFPTIPLWLNEGMAELYSTFTSNDKRVRIGAPIVQHVQTLRRHGLMPLEELFAVDTDSPSYNEGLKQGVFYAQSWALVHYLLLGDAPRQDQALAFLRSLEEGVAPSEAFPAVFGVAPAVLERELETYLRGFTINVAEGPAPERVDSRYRVRPLARHELLFRLADLLAHTQEEQHAAAEAHARAALDIAPEHGPSLALLGYLRQEAGDLASARQLYAQAARHALDDPQIQYLYADSLLAAFGGSLPAPGEIDADARAQVLDARRALERSLEVRPGFAQAWADLGLTYAIDAVPPPSAVTALERAASMLPSRIDVQFNLLLLYTRLGKREQAEALFARVIVPRAPPEVRANARQALLNLDIEWLNRLIQADRLDEAVPLLERIVEVIEDPALRVEMTMQLATLRRALAHNRFADGYNRAAGLANRRDYAGAIAVLEPLVAGLPPGPDRDDAQALLDEIRARRGD